MSFLVLFTVIFGCTNAPKKNQKEEKIEPKYQENWESLAKHNEQPDWFQDAKLGIYFHWGVYYVPAFGSNWYPRKLHFESQKE